MATNWDEELDDVELALNNPFDEGDTVVDSTKTDTEQDAIRKDVLAKLDELGSLSVKDDAIKFVGEEIVLPARFSNSLKQAAKFLIQIDEAENTHFSFSRTFKYRPWDGAAAFQRALYRVFGTTGIGKATQTMFGEIPPRYVSIAVGFGKTEQVPWGEVSMPTLDAVFELGSAHDPEYGMLFAIEVDAPRRNRKRIEAFFDVVQNELEERSIYRGRAFNGADTPEFLDLTWVDEKKVVYADEVFAQLNANVWSLIEHTDTMRELGIPLKRAVLLEGPFGTGKSLAGAVTAKRATEQAKPWTFILARPGQDNLFEVLNTAKLYAPAVVQFEDIDTLAKGGTDAEISKLLDALDGIGNKGNGVVALFTTNHVENIQKAVMRPGRIDSIIHIEKLDRAGVEKLIKVIVSPKVLSPNVDYDVVYSQVKNFLPAFIKEALDRTIRYAVSRTGGTQFVIETDDIVNAAIGLHTQLELMEKANEGPKKVPTIDAALTEVIQKAAEMGTKDVINASGMVNAKRNSTNAYDFQVDEKKLS